MKLIIDRLFFLSIVAIILGFLGYVISSFLPLVTTAVHANKPNDTIIFAQQIRELDELRQHLEGVDESELRDEFDFDEIETKNIDWQKDRYAKSFFNVDYDLDKYVSVGTTMISMQEMVINMETGKSQRKEYKPAPFIVITEKHQSAKKRYLKLAELSYVPETIAGPVRDLVSTAEENVRIFGKVLNSAVEEFSDRFKTRDDMQHKEIWIHNRFMKEFIGLKPKASAVNKAIRAYIRTESVR